MIADLKPYPAMKDSGVPWLGEVPEHWDVRRLGALLSERGETNAEGRITDVLSVLKDRGVIPYAEKGNIGNKKSEDITRYKIVRPNDIVVNCMNVIIGSVGLSKFTGCLSPVYYVLTRRSETDRSRYLDAYFQTRPFQRSLVRIGNGILAHRMRVPMELLKCEPFPRPPTQEQAAIVRYLDHADRRIQRYIRAKQKLITLLEEQKQALIHQAVTGQIDVRTGQPYPAYKPSAVRWLGNIPEHWEVWQIGHLGRVGNGSTPSRSNMGYWDGGTYPWLNSSSVNHSPIMQADQFVTDLALRECHLPQIQPGSVLVAITGQGKTRGTSAVLDTEATINQHVACVTTRNDVIGAEYLQLALLAAYRELRAISDGSGSTKGALTCWDISHFRVPLPPRAEQAEIILATRQATKTLESASGKAAQEVMLAREYRIRLIADVVTGKLDVREAASRLPDEAEEPEPRDETNALTDGEEFTDDLDAAPEEAAV